VTPTCSSIAARTTDYRHHVQTNSAPTLSKTSEPRWNPRDWNSICGNYSELERVTWLVTIEVNRCVRECFRVSGASEDAAMANNLDALLARAKSIRQDILRMTTEAGSGHPSSSLSAVEIVTALYFDGFLRHDSQNPHWPDRDRFILSKGHAAPVLYAALAQAGYFPHDEIMTLRKLGSALEGHPNMKRLAGVEASTGSLGQGLSIGIGHALAARIDNHVQCV
jgi:Transketolase, thiamine diphosphate binding domain